MKKNWAEWFKLYDEANPLIYAQFKHFAYQLLESGRHHGGAKQIMERIRWETAISGRDQFKINNNYATGYAKKLVAEAPRFEGFFSFRKKGDII